MNKLVDKIYFKGLSLMGKANKLLKDERGDTNIIAIIIILAIVIGLAIVFKTQLSALFSKIWTNLFSNTDRTLIDN